MAKVLELINVNKVYGEGETATHALKNITVNVEQGEFIAIIGQSGSGKTTLLNMIGALDRPTSGEIKIAGQSLSGKNDNALSQIRREHLGFIFQFHHLLPNLTAYENICLPFEIDHDRVSQNDRATADELLRLVGLEHRAQSPVTKLSGGQQQRIAIARALSGNKTIILADEPTGNLDSDTSREVFAIMRKVNAERGQTFLIVTHNEDLARRCDRVIMISNGSIDSDKLT
jgi:lipoprotein-releasing system ATP-binding protein